MKKTWTTKEGREIEIANMEDSHLINAIKLIRRHAKEGMEIAIDCGYCGDDDYKTYESSEISGKEVFDYFDGYHDLIKEAKKRGLTIT